MKLIQLCGLHVWVLPLLAACGGRIDVAEVVLGAKVLNEDGSTGAELPLGATAEALPAATLGPSPSVVEMASPQSSGCFDLVPIAEFSTAHVSLIPVPSAGCSYQFETYPGSCTGTWYCCDEVFSVTSVDGGNGITETYRTASTAPFPLPAIADAVIPGGEPRAPWQCWLEGYGAVSEIAVDLSYTPAWALAVSEYLMEAPPEILDPIPIGCTYTPTIDGCGASLICPEHSYYAAVDGAGGVICERDGEPVTPTGYAGYEHTVRRHVQGGCFPGDSTWVPGNECFGDGWSAYFQFAAEGT